MLNVKLIKLFLVIFLCLENAFPSSEGVSLLKVFVGTNNYLVNMFADSIYQPAVDLCIQKLQRGEWVHIFPGKFHIWCSLVLRNLNFFSCLKIQRAKWTWRKSKSVSNGASEGSCLNSRKLVPMQKSRFYPFSMVNILIFMTPTTSDRFHCFLVGMDELLPNTPPYWFHFNTKLTFNFGKPIDLNETFKQIEENKTDKTEARRLITEVIQKRLESLRAETEVLHKKS